MWEGEVWWVIERGGGKQEWGEDNGEKMFSNSLRLLNFEFLLSKSALNS